MIADIVFGAIVMAGAARAQVTATGTMGETSERRHDHVVIGELRTVPRPSRTYHGYCDEPDIDGSIGLRQLDRRLVGLFPSHTHTADRRSCIFGPPEPNSVIGNTEGEEVAWCVRKLSDIILDAAYTVLEQRNNARVIPDGTFSAVHFVKTPLYVQVMGLGDFTKINIANEDEGGELDPHGATGLGNPVGGNVTSNVSGSDVHYEEWMKWVKLVTHVYQR